MKPQSYQFFLSLAVVISIVSACEKIESTRVECNFFSLALGSDWEFITLQGYDTYVGKFTNGHEEIEIDFGHFAGVNPDAIQQTNEMTYYEEVIIDGAPAKIVEVNKNGVTTLILYIHKDEGNSGKAINWMMEKISDDSIVN